MGSILLISNYAILWNRRIEGVLSGSEQSEDAVYHYFIHIHIHLMADHTKFGHRIKEQAVFDKHLHHVASRAEVASDEMLLLSNTE